MTTAKDKLSGGLGLTENTAKALAASLLIAADELGPGARYVTAELGDGRKFILIISIPDPTRAE